MKIQSKVLNKSIRPVCFFLLCLFSLEVCAVSITVTEKNKRGNFPLVITGKAAPLVIDPKDEEVVAIVTKDFSEDVELVTNVKPQIIHRVEAGTLPVIIGTLGKSSYIDKMESTGKIQTVDVAGKWETFSISVVENPLPGIKQALVIFGSTPRGTAFGVFELSRMIGVSPLVWWSDVTPKHKQNLYITQGKNIFGPPSVQYRGLFINDEDWGLQPWAAKNMDKNILSNGKGDIGPKTYEKVFELMLRLKSNYLWPGMHPCTKAFWYYQGNPELARKYSIVLGSSHCEQMLRNNVDEWTNNYQSEYGEAHGEWNWVKNKDKIVRYWADRVKQSKNNDAIYTIGMRGIHDSEMPGYKTEEEKNKALKDVIANQRNILEAGLGEAASLVPQIFCPYKEALKLYRLGLDLADDISLLWADDNFGYIRQLPNPSEQLRNGGSGVYYHFSYWGWPEDFLWLSSTSPALTAYELMKAYELNSKKIWIFNVGDIKPQEFELQFAMDFAWDINSVDMNDPNLYAKKWGDDTFEKGLGEAIYQIQKEYYALAAAGKTEHIDRINYTVQEMEQRLADYEQLVKKEQALETKIPVNLQDAYFQLIKYPVEASAAMNMKVLGARLSFDYGKQGRKENALSLAAKSKAAYQKIIALTHRYNKEISGGKWDGMMDYAPRGLKKFYDVAVVSAGSIIEKNAPDQKIQQQITIIPAGKYRSINGNGYRFKTINGLGVAESALTVWPLNMKTYSENDVASAPYVDYLVPVRKGSNTIEVKCLPTFPLYQGLQLRYAISVDKGAPVTVSIKTEAETSAWSANVLRGYALGIETYKSETNKNINIRIHFLDPGVVLSSLKVSESN